MSFGFGKQGPGSGLPFPLGVIGLGNAATQQIISPVWFQDPLRYYWFYEDFLWDAFDIAKHPLALYDAEATDQNTLDLVADEPGGAFQIKLGAANESKTAGFTMGNNLYIRGNQPFLFLTRLKVVQTMAANQEMVWGLASDVDTNVFDDLARNCMFRLSGDADLLIETDDGTNDNDDQDTGFDVTADTYYWFGIERGFDGSLYFRKADGNGENVRTWTMSKTFGKTEPSFGNNNLQPIILAQKASGTTTPEFKVDVLLFAGLRV